MADVNLMFGFANVVGVVQLDCTISEIHTDEAKITDYPVQTGSVVSDHIRLQPTTIELEVIVTNTPTSYMFGPDVQFNRYAKTPVSVVSSMSPASPLTSDLNPVEDRVNVAYGELRRILQEGEVVSVLTTLRDYDDMAITKSIVTRDKEKGNALFVKLTLSEIIMAETQTVAVPVRKSTANNTSTNRGQVTPTESSAAQTESLLHLGANRIFQ